jgi:LmbE family N-acetylglucosaminyl deacetylase
MINPEVVAVIAPHPDDEILGVGGSLREFSRCGIKTALLIVSGHLPPLYSYKEFERTKVEAEKAKSIVGVDDIEFLEVPATKVHQLETAELNGKISDFIRRKSPDTVFIPFPDRHIDHRTIFDACLVACRPVGVNHPLHILAYETLSETYWNAPYIEPNFQPNLFIDITKSIESKIEALEAYASQINGSPSRSPDAVRALARFRGSQNNCEFAEAFQLIRSINFIGKQT